MAQRFEGKNLEDALTNASQTFGVERYQLTYHVVLEKRGFLGGMKRVVIEADINTEGAQPVVEPATPPEEHSTPRGPRAARGGREGRGEKRQRGGRRRRERSEEDALQPGDLAQFSAEVPEQTPQSEAAAEVAAWCERVIVLAKLDLQVRTEENDAQIVVKLYGRDAPRMIERHGEALDALQVLTNKAVVGRKTEKDVEVDCQEFKGKRVEELEQKARQIAEQVRRDGHEQVLPAMTPIERRIVHLALRDDVEVTTESRGDGFYKRVAIVRRPAQQEQSSTAS